MKKLSQIFIKGLFTLLPVVITLWILFWLGSTAEHLLGNVLKFILPDAWYVSGMGLIAGFVVTMVVGTMVKAYVFRRVVRKSEELLGKIPLVKTIYNSIKDVADFASGSNSKGLQKVVMVQLDNDIKMMGFVTNDDLSIEQSDLCSVYVPLSYQIGGLTLLLPESKLTVINMEVKEAMHFMLTAGIPESSLSNKSPQEEDIIDEAESKKTL